MEKLWSILFMIVGLIYLVRGYLIHTHKRTKMMSGVYRLTPIQQEAMIPIIAPYYMITGLLLMVSPFVQAFIGNLTWFIIIIYLFIGAIRISNKRSEFHKENAKKS